MILGYNLEICPFCKESAIQQIGESILCCKCGIIHDKAALLANILNIPANLAAKAYQRNDYGTPIDAIYSATVNGTIVNSLQEDGAPQFNYPSIFPYIPEMGDVYVIDSALPTYPNSVLFTGGWAPTWTPLLINGNRKVYLLYTNESQARAIAMKLKEAGGRNTYLSRLGEGMSIEDAILQAIPYTPVSTERYKDPNATESLKELIDSFHWVSGGMGRSPIYKRSMNSPPYLVTEAVINWFKKSGAQFLWDEINECGYMYYRDMVYHLNHHNPMLKSLLWTEGGLLINNGDGAAILEGISCQAFDSKKIKPGRWLTCDPVNHIIKINQDSSMISIAQNEINVNTSDSLTYQKIAGIKPWWFPMEYIKEAKADTAAQMLWEYVCRYFVVPDVAKEITICWLLCSFLADYSPTRPGFRISGEAASGKSTLLILLHWLFYGNPDAKLPKINTMAGFWRAGMIHPVLLLDNTNVRDKNMGNDFRDFLDLAATGSERVMGVNSHNPFETRSQIAHTLVAISGLDDFMHGDVKTRYIETRSNVDFQTDFSTNEDKQRILDNRSYMLSAVLNIISREMLSDMSNIINKETIKKGKIFLGSKSRIVDYYLLMLRMAKCLGMGDVNVKWSEYIRENSTKADIANSDTIEWWRNFKIAYHLDEMIKFNHGALLIQDKDRMIGIKGSKAQLISALSASARVLNRKLPWSRAISLIDAHIEDKNAWKQLGWTFKKTSDDMFEVYWGEAL